MNTLTQLGMRIRYLRKQLGMSQLDLALEADVNKNYISDLERGMRNSCRCFYGCAEWQAGRARAFRSPSAAHGSRRGRAQWRPQARPPRSSQYAQIPD